MNSALPIWAWLIVVLSLALNLVALVNWFIQWRFDRDETAYFSDQKENDESFSAMLRQKKREQIRREIMEK